MMLFFCGLATVLTSTQQNSDYETALNHLRQLGIISENQRPRLISRSLSSDIETIKHVFVEQATVRLRDDDTLYSYRWDIPTAISSARRGQPSSVLAETARASARASILRMWPTVQIQISLPYDGGDYLRPSWMMEFYPFVSGIQIDESHSGIVEIDSIGGELLWLRSPSTPLPPPAVTPRLNRQEAEAILYNQLATTRRDPAFEFRLPVDLRIWGGVRGYKKPGRLVYRIEANGYYPGREGAMLPKHLIKMDAMTGEIVNDATSYPGGPGPVDPKAVPLTKRAFDVVLHGKKRIAAPGAMVKSLKETATPPTGGKRAILMGKKGMLSLTAAPDGKRVLLKLADKKGDKWWEGQPNMALLAALQKI